MIENSKGVLIRRSKEGRKGAATAMDMVQERVNKSTRDTEAVIFVQDQTNPSVSQSAALFQSSTVCGTVLKTDGGQRDISIHGSGDELV